VHVDNELTVDRLESKLNLGSGGCDSLRSCWGIEWWWVHPVLEFRKLVRLASNSAAETDCNPRKSQESGANGADHASQQVVAGQEVSGEAKDVGSDTKFKRNTSVLVQLEAVLSHIFVNVGAAGESPNAEEWNTSSALNAHADTGTAHNHDESVHAPVVDLGERLNDGESWSSRVLGDHLDGKAGEVQSSDNKTEGLVEHHEVSDVFLLLISLGGEALLVLNETKTSKDGSTGSPVEELHRVVVLSGASLGFDREVGLVEELVKHKYLNYKSLSFLSILAR
jgi:hypothetical protein